MMVTLPGAIPGTRIDTMQTAEGDTALAQDFVGATSWDTRKASTELVSAILAATASGRRALIIRAYFPLEYAKQASREVREMIRSISATTRPPGVSAPPTICAALKSVIACGDAFASIQREPLQPRGAVRRWASSVQLPGSTTPATITEDRGERVFETSFGSWEVIMRGFGPSLPDQREADERFKALRVDLRSCFPDWGLPKDDELSLVLSGPTHVLKLAVLDSDQEGEGEWWLTLRVVPRAAARRLLDP
jgi:hypothetical protein